MRAVRGAPHLGSEARGRERVLCDAFDVLPGTQSVAVFFSCSFQLVFQELENLSLADSCIGHLRVARLPDFSRGPSTEGVVSACPGRSGVGGVGGVGGGGFFLAW